MVFKSPKIKRKKTEGDGSTSSGSRLSRSTLLFIFLGILLVLSGLLNFCQYKAAPQKAPQVSSNTADLSLPLEPDHTSEIDGVWYGLCPKNSIHSIADFKHQVDTDPLLAIHYADFKWEKARIGHHPNPIYTHVTYRKNGKIGVTRKVLKLPAGDGFITDGDRWVRMYCGNDYVLANSATPQLKGSEDVDTDLNRLIERADRSSRTVEETFPKEKDPVVVPESGSFLMVFAGLGLLSLLSLFNQKKKQLKRRRRVLPKV